MGYRKSTNEVEKDDFKYTEEFMQAKLSNFFARNSVKYDIDGLYIFDWESDKFIETRSGLIYEFEIKVSKSDFKNDFKHKKDKHIILEGEEKYGDKYLPKYYDCLRANEEIGDWAVKSFHKYADDSPRYLVGGHNRPNYFYYCTPPGMIEETDVPWYAGLVQIDKAGQIRIKKKAPKLHGEKIKDEELGLGEKFYYNMDSWRRKCKQALEDKEYWKEKLEAEVDGHGNGRAYADIENELEGYKKSYHELCKKMEQSDIEIHRELYRKNTMVRKLIREVQKYNQSFDYDKFYTDTFGEN